MTDYGAMWIAAMFLFAEGHWIVGTATLVVVFWPTKGRN